MCDPRSHAPRNHPAGSSLSVDAPNLQPYARVHARAKSFGMRQTLNTHSTPFISRDSQILRARMAHVLRGVGFAGLCSGAMMYFFAAQSAPGSQTLIRAQSENTTEIKRTTSSGKTRVLHRAPSGDLVYAQHPEIKVRSTM